MPDVVVDASALVDLLRTFRLDSLVAGPIARHPVGELLLGAFAGRDQLRLADALYVELAAARGWRRSPPTVVCDPFQPWTRCRRATTDRLTSYAVVPYSPAPTKTWRARGGGSR